MRFFELLMNLTDVDTADEDVALGAPVTDRAQDVKPGGVFVARSGAMTDGHDYISRAVANGAAAVVGERPRQEVDCPVPYARVRDARAALGILSAAFYGFPSRHMVMIGVTGTDGKTTTINLLYHILKLAGIQAGMVSTVSAVIGPEETPTGLHVTTPSAPEVQGYLARMVENGQTHCVMEVTSHGLVQGRVNGVDFDVAVLTNVSHEHLDYHGTWEAYRDAKTLLFRQMSQSVPKPGQPKVSVVNLDDPSAEIFAAFPAERHLTYSVTQPEATAFADAIEHHPAGTRFQVNGVAYHSPLVGLYNVSNALAAIAVAESLQIPADMIVQGIATAPQVPGRMERIDEGQDFLAVVDFAHTPNSLLQVLTTARTLIAPGKRVICVVGSAGLRDRAKRRMMAEIAAEHADLVILTAEDPRTESLEAILDEMAAGCQAKGGVEDRTYFRVQDRGWALYQAVQKATSGDIVLACGKGHEQSMCFGSVEYAWDDRQALRSALQGSPELILPTAQHHLK